MLMFTRSPHSSLARHLHRHAAVLGLAVVGLMVAGAQPGAHASPRESIRSAAPRADEAPYGRRDDVLALAQRIADQAALDPVWVADVLTQARFNPAVQRLMQPAPAGRAKDWATYRARFIEPVRVRAGVAFWREHAAWLREAEQRYGVPASVVVGVVGVETLYGRHLGGFRVIDALATLSLDFPRTDKRDRSAFFSEELQHFLVLCHQQGQDPLAVLGSYAGAMGLPQFMPSSWLKYAVDFDGDGRIDLHANSADAIGSVANYLAAFGWQRGQPTHYDVSAPAAVSDRAALLLPDILPSFTATQFAERGAALDATGRQHDGPLALVELQNGAAAPSYVAGTQNFYALTRYNWSSYYAMAVIELGRAVAAVAEAAR